MGYCSILDIEMIIANALTSATDATSQQRRNLLQIGRIRDKNLISDDTVNQYIQWASSEIDASLNGIYATPICQMADFEDRVYSDITEYNSFIVMQRACPLSVGDNIIVVSGNNQEDHIISEVVGNGVFATLEPIQYAFEEGARVIRVKFPDPLPLICSRLAAANIYDKYFSSQVSPNISDFGKTLRSHARSLLSDILNGRTVLRGVPRTGRRLYDPTIPSQYGLMEGQQGAKELDKLQ